jgi:tryptophan-rich sensory protein
LAGVANATQLGPTDWVWCPVVLVLKHSFPAVLLLIPYLLWSPIGTLVTWQMQRLNR